MSFNENKWSELIDFDKYFDNKKTEIYESDNDEEEVKLNINSIDFSLNNEKILHEINKILQQKNFKNYTSLEILKNQDLVSSYISKSIQNNIINKKFFIECISYLKNTSKLLSEKISQALFTHNYNFIKKDKIIRSSYKFCNYKHDCTYNYEKGKKGCYADHYPHNMIYADCDALLECINLYYIDDNEIQNKELVRCINTISFVIRHMYEEINNLCMYSTRAEHDKFHFIKSNNQKKFNNTKVRDVDI